MPVFSQALQEYPINQNGTRSTKIVKLYFIIYNNSAGLGGVPITRPAAILAALNGFFVGSDFTFYFNPCDIVQINNDNLFGNNGYCPYFFQNPQLSDGIIIHLKSDGNGSIAFASSVPGKEIILGGLSAGVSPSLSSSLAHEMGHCLGLFHTHHRTCTVTIEQCDGTEYTTGSPFFGDYVSDTPKDPNLSGKVDASCVWDEDIECNPENLSSFSPLVNNFMSYSNVPCKTAFTPGQISRMHELVPSEVVQGTVNDGCCINNSPSLSTSSITTLCPQFSVDLNNFITSQNEPFNTIIWSTDGNSLDGVNPVISSTIYNSGNYFAYYYNSIRDCYSPPVSINVLIESCCPVGPDIIITNPNEVFNNVMNLEGNIIINTNSKLTITSNIYFGENKGIIVKSGGELVINGGTLSSCLYSSLPIKWKGIESQGKVTMNGAVIENAKIGLLNNNGQYSISNSRFSICDIGMLENKQNAKNNIIDNVNFQDCEFGIEVNDAKNFFVKNCRFSNLSIDIFARNSVINVTNSDFFAPTGILLDSPFPNLDGSIIDGNRFLNSLLNGGIGIFLEGTANLIPHEISGNFFGNEGSGIFSNGITAFDISNNDFYSDYGVRTWDNGLDKSQMVINNTFNSLENGGEATGYNDTEYNDNCFDYSLGAHLKLNSYSGINENQGDGGIGNKEAGNCFASGLIRNIDEEPNSSKFIYHIWENTPSGSCKDPKSGQSYNTVWELLDDSQIEANFVNCGSSYYIPNLPKNIKFCIIPKSLADKKKMESDLRKQYFSILTNQNINPSIKKWLLNRILRCYKVLIGKTVKQTTEEETKQIAFSLLDSFPSFHNKIIAYSLLLEDEELVNARIYLNTIAYNEEEVIDFKITQNIYLDYLSNRETFILLPSQRNTLYQVGIKHNEYSSFARSIYYILTGERILPDLSRVTDEGLDSSPRQAHESVVKPGISIYPNPATSSFVNIEVNLLQESEGKLTADLYDIFGKKLSAIGLQNGNNKFDVSTVNNGIYVMKINHNSEVIKVQKILITK